MGLPKMDQFKVVEMFNDSQGKTSPSLVVGVCSAFVSLGAFASSGLIIQVMILFKIEQSSEIIGFFSMLTNQSIVLFGMAVTLIGVHRMTKDKAIELQSPKEEPSE